LLKSYNVAETIQNSVKRNLLKNKGNHMKEIFHHKWEQLFFLGKRICAPLFLSYIPNLNLHSGRISTEVGAIKCSHHLLVSCHRKWQQEIRSYNGKEDNKGKEKKRTWYKCLISARP